MSRRLAELSPTAHGHLLMGGESVIFHCNHYNYWLQKTLRLDEKLGMDEVIVDAAASTAYAMLTGGIEALDLREPKTRLELAADTFAELGYGTIDFSAATDQGGVVRLPTSHFGQMLRGPAGANFAKPQNLFDQGYVAGALAAAYGLEAGCFEATLLSCHSIGGGEGRVRLTRRLRPAGFFESPGKAIAGEAPPPPFAETNIDEATILATLAGFDLSGNEEGLVSRFGVSVTYMMANFYNRISFEFVKRMAGTGLLGPAEELLVEAACRCAFNTFGGIMTSPEWDAVVRPQCKTPTDWVHGMVATINALGWGTWRVVEVDEQHLVVRIYDDYESVGYLGMYGRADRHISYLAQGAAAGLMNLVFTGRIADGVTMDDAFYARIFESPEAFHPIGTRCLAMGDGYTEVIVRR